MKSAHAIFGYVFETWHTAHHRGALYEVRNDSFALDSGNASCRVIPLSDARGLSDGSGHTTRTYVRAIKAVLASLRSAVPHSESGTGA